MTRLAALDNKSAGSDAFGLTNYDQLQADISYLVVAGADLAALGASNTLAITARFHHVTLAGSSTIDNISDALGAVASQEVRLWFDNAQTIRNQGGGTGNIRTLDGNDLAVSANQIIALTYDGTNWRIGTSTPKASYVGVDSTSGTATAVIANQAYLLPFTMPAAGTISWIAYAAGASAGNLDVGIYDAAGNRKVSSGATAAGTGTNKVTLAATLLAAGKYWLAMAANNTGFTPRSFSGGLTYAARAVATSYPLPNPIVIGSSTPTWIPGLLAEVT